MHLLIIIYDRLNYTYHLSFDMYNSTLTFNKNNYFVFNDCFYTSTIKVIRYYYQSNKETGFTSTRTNCRERSTLPVTIPCFAKAEFISCSGIAHGTSFNSTA
ncbi:hypothetical protein PUN28_014113 [Cardiocondyla obscurior]|uniref:Uncharacterized protein n=1 Tax=Cardiocondyla obscurior TaxID=286306 RepID=A0AAW2F047_9HYME